MMKRYLAAFTAILLVICMLLPVAAETPTFVAVNNDSPDGQRFFLSDCDESEGWFTSQGKVWRDHEEGTEGGACVAFTTDVEAYANQSWTIQGRFDTKDLSSVDKISFDICVSDLSLFDAAYQVTAALVSGGTNSGNELTWEAAMMTQTYTEDEWLHVELPVTQAAAKGFDWKNANVFRLKFRRLSPQEMLKDVTVRLDNICAESYPTKAIMLLDCDDTTLWNQAGFSTGDHKQGFGCVSFRSTTTAMEEGDHNMVKQVVFPHPIDARNADYLELDLYVSDAQAVQTHTSNYGLHIEITSSGRCDAEEYQFMVQNFGAGLKDGWNHLRLPIASAGTSGGPCDLRRVNFFRIHLLGLHTAKNNELILKLDNIYLSVVQDGVEDYPEEVTPPAGGEETPPVGGEELPPVDGEDNTPSGEDNVPPVGENTDSEQTPADDTAAQLAQRKALTARRSRIVVLLFAFLIVGTDIVVVALRRRSEAEIAPDAEGQMQQALDVSKAADPEQETPGQDGGPTADQ